MISIVLVVMAKTAWAMAMNKELTIHCKVFCQRWLDPVIRRLAMVNFIGKSLMVLPKYLRLPVF